MGCRGRRSGQSDSWARGSHAACMLLAVLGVVRAFAAIWPRGTRQEALAGIGSEADNRHA